MRWTICYGFMTTCLLSVLGYSVYSGPGPTPSLFGKGQPGGSDFLRDVEPVIVRPAESAGAPSAPAAPVAAEPAVATAPQLSVGASRSEVISLMGQPKSIDANGGWNYGSQIVLFKDEKVAGSIELDQGKILKEAWSAFQAQSQSPIASSTASKPSRAKARSAGIKRSKTARRSYAARGSTLWEPMFRSFFSDKPLPRNRSHTRSSSGRAPWVTDRYRGKEPMYIRR